VTKNSGVYGWAGNRSLHVVYLCDARGFLVRNDLLSTVDESGARTDLQLKKDESAAVVRIPVTLASAEPINFNVRQYDATAVGMALNGQGQVQVCVKNGEFPVKPGATYRVTAEMAQQVVAGGDATLAFPLALDGPTTLRIKAVR
jgi:hypothetical protein